MTDAYDIVVPGVGPVPCPGMIIGEAPGRTEIEQGIPFCGKSGEVLDKALARAGVHRGSHFITNIFKGDVGSGNRNPTSDEIDAHRGALLQELERVNPQGILLLGRVATEAFLPKVGRLADYIESRCVGEFDGRSYNVFPCYHPSYILRSPDKFELFVHSVMKFVLVTATLGRLSGKYE